MYYGCPPHVKEHLISEAKKYEFEDIVCYIKDIDWESDWMPDLIENPDEEMLTDNDIRAINDVLIKAFEIAHNRRVSYYIRRDLLLI